LLLQRSCYIVWSEVGGLLRVAYAEVLLHHLVPNKAVSMKNVPQRGIHVRAVDGLTLFMVHYKSTLKVDGERVYKVRTSCAYNWMYSAPSNHRGLAFGKTMCESVICDMLYAICKVEEPEPVSADYTFIVSRNTIY
jgi:hypothetical protein